MPEGVQGTQGGQPPREPYVEESNSGFEQPASNSVPAGARTGSQGSVPGELAGDYDPNDDKALKKLNDKIAAKGAESLEETLLKHADDDRMISENAFSNFLSYFDTSNRDSIRLLRIAGYTRHEGQKFLIGDVMNHLNGRDAKSEAFAD